MELNRRKSTGGILKRSKEKRLSSNEEEIIHSYKDSKQLQNRMPDPKFHEKKQMYDRRDQLVSIEITSFETSGKFYVQKY